MSSILTDEDWSHVDTTDDSRASQEAGGSQIVLTPRPRHRSASPRDGSVNRDMAGCALRGRHLTPGELQSVSGMRRRYNSMSGCTMSRPRLSPRSVADTPRKLRVSRDATQPATGSMRSLRSSSQDSEEADEFPDRSLTAVGSAVLPVCGRPRAATCPESKAFRRRARVRSFNRPPTPTPTPAGTDNESPATTNDPEGDDSAQRLAELRLNVGYIREPTNGRSGTVVTKSPSLGSCGADLPAISESQ